MSDQRQQSVDFYQAEASTYDARRWSSRVGRYLDEVQRSVVADLAGDLNGKVVLDVATGTGRFALDMAASGAIVHAVDTSSAMLEMLLTKAQEENLSDKIFVHESDGASLPFAADEFDIVTCVNALNHIPNASGVVEDIARVMKPGGKIVTNFTVWSSIYLPIGLYVNARQKSLTRDVFTHWFSKREIHALLAQSGFDIERKAGALQFPARMKNSILVDMCIRFDRLCRRNWAIAPMLFVAGVKRS